MIITHKGYDITGTPEEVLDLLDLIDHRQEVVVAAPAADPEEQPKKPNRPKQYKKELDVGKIKALRKAGWTLQKIADEMRVSPQTIANHLKKEGEA